MRGKYKPRTEPVPGTGPKDWVPPDDGIGCGACPHGEFRHPKREHCLYCRCTRFQDKGLGL